MGFAGEVGYCNERAAAGSREPWGSAGTVKGRDQRTQRGFVLKRIVSLSWCSVPVMAGPFEGLSLGHLFGWEK